uniref:Uncharacterized protein n=1 Tax=Plectus sambesii TaxID=2011161 RepID=A0A914X5Y2_9BILA
MGLAERRCGILAVPDRFACSIRRGVSLVIGAWRTRAAAAAAAVDLRVDSRASRGLCAPGARPPLFSFFPCRRRPNHRPTGCVVAFAQRPVALAGSASRNNGVQRASFKRR